MDPITLCLKGMSQNDRSSKMILLKFNKYRLGGYIFAHYCKISGLNESYKSVFMFIITLQNVSQMKNREGNTGKPSCTMV